MTEDTMKEGGSMNVRGILAVLAGVVIAPVAMGVSFAVSYTFLVVPLLLPYAVCYALLGA